MIRIVFINLKDTVGGGVIAMNRLGTELEKDKGVESFYIVGRKKTHRSNVIATRNRIGRIIEERIIDPLTAWVGLQYFWFPFSTPKILKEVRKFKPDVINLHLSHSGYFQTSLLKRLSKEAPIVWTLHDMWSFTGNAAHTFGDESWKILRNNAQLTKIYPSIGINTGSWLLRQKRDIYKKSRLTMVTPSDWLLKLAKQSPVFEGKKIVHINNGIDLEVFRPYDKKEIRRELNIPLSAKVLMFSAAYLKGDMWKGGDHLQEILRKINEAVDYKIHLLLIGQTTGEVLFSFSNFVIYETGYITDEIKMAKFLSSSDLFIYPTKADNLPNVLVEAIACGTPCATFDIGGCAEIILNNYNGFVVSPFDFSSLVSSILRVLSDQNELDLMSKNARLHAKKYFSVSEMAISYKQLFEEMRNKK